MVPPCFRKTRSGDFGRHALSGKTRNKRERIAAFWRWFTENSKRVFLFDDDFTALTDYEQPQSVFDEVSTQLKRVCPELGFEFGPIFSGRREFVISASGEKALFPFVSQVVAATPESVRELFDVTALRPRRPATVWHMTLSVGIFHCDDLRFRLRKASTPAGAKYDLDVFVPTQAGGSQNDWLTRVMASLDPLLGEWDTEMHIRYIAVKPLPVVSSGEAESDGLCTLADLPQTLDRLLGRAPRPAARFPWQSGDAPETALSDEAVAMLLRVERDKARLRFA